MLTTYTERPVETSGLIEASAFTIKATGKSYKILMDGLYSDKPLAAVRELWSNAHDAHVAAGNEAQPFECHLPTQWGPEFRVRDFGISMTHAEVMKTYSTFFESTKEDNNEQVGKLGLGSKSPFAYTDAFTVTAWRDGEQRTYAAWIDTDHIPKIALVERKASSEARGLQVSFGVRSQDNLRFAIAASKVARGFKTQPLVSGNTSFKQPGAPILEGPGWRFIGGDDDAVAVQGCVAYPIDYDAVSDNRRARAVRDLALQIEFPIGSLEIVASREELSYDTRTKDIIAARLEAVYDEVCDALVAKINAFDTHWGAVSWVLNNLAQNGQIREAIEPRLMKGRREGTFTADKKTVLAREFRHLDARGRQGMTRQSMPKREINHISVTPNRPARIYYTVEAGLTLNKIWGRIKRHYEENGTGRSLYWARLSSDKSLVRLNVALGGGSEIEYVDVAALADLPKAYKAKTELRPLRVADTSRVKDWKARDYAPRGVYVPFHAGQVIGPDGTPFCAMTSRFDLLMDWFRRHKPGEFLFGANKALCKRFEKDPNWTSVWDELRAYMQANATYFKDHAEWAARRRSPSYLQNWPEASLKALNNGPLKDAIKAERKALKQYSHDASVRAAAERDLANRFDMVFWEPAEQADIEEALHARYPMLGLVSLSYPGAREAAILTNYVNSIDVAST